MTYKVPEFSDNVVKYKKIMYNFFNPRKVKQKSQTSKINA